jgi:hypothetical protein
MCHYFFFFLFKIFLRKIASFLKLPTYALYFYFVTAFLHKSLTLRRLFLCIFVYFLVTQNFYMKTHNTYSKNKFISALPLWTITLLPYTLYLHVNHRALTHLFFQNIKSTIKITSSSLARIPTLFSCSFTLR